MRKEEAHEFVDYLSAMFEVHARLRYKDPRDTDQTQSKWCINLYASEDDAESDAEPTAVIYQAFVNPNYYGFIKPNGN